LAGVQDASQHTYSENDYSNPPPIPQSDNDLESQTIHSLTPRPSRASLPLPLGRRASRKSFRSDATSHPSLFPTTEDEPPLPDIPQNYTTRRDSHDDTAAAAADEAEIPWGPQHPCFPHPNPHVPLQSPEYIYTRVIRVQRDWLIAGDLYPALQNMYPEILAEQISEAEFRDLIESLNGMLERTFGPWSGRAAVDAVMGVLTGFLWDDAGFTGAKKGVKGIEQWMERWNEKKRAEGKDVRLVPLRRTGFLNLDIIIPDPGIDGSEEGEGEGSDMER